MGLTAGVHDGPLSGCPVQLHLVELREPSLCLRRVLTCLDYGFGARCHTHGAKDNHPQAVVICYEFGMFHSR